MRAAREYYTKSDPNLRDVMTYPFVCLLIFLPFSTLPFIASTHPFTPASLRFATDSFALVTRVTGAPPAGYVIQTISREGDHIRIVVDYDLIGALRQRVNMEMDGTTLAPIRHTETVQQPGRGQVRADIVINNGRAKGDFVRALAMVDVPVDADAIDDEASTALLPSLPLRDGYATSFTTFAAPGRTETTRVTVTGRETVAVPAGTFEAFRLVVMARDTSYVFVTTSSPRRVVLVRLPDGSGEMRLLR